MRVQETALRNLWRAESLTRRSRCSGRGEVRAVVGEHGVDRVGHGFDQGAEKVSGHASCRFLVRLDEGELGDPIDGNQEVEPALGGLNLGNVDMEVIKRVGFELALA